MGAGQARSIRHSSAGRQPLLFDFGSAVASKKLHSPWIKDRVFPMSSWMRNSVPYEAGFQNEFDDTLVRILKDHGIENARVGIDIIDYRALEVLQKNGFTIVDGQEIMLDARVIKTQDEIFCWKAPRAWSTHRTAL